MIVTIDGPAGAGKSTAARALAQRLGFQFLDTGAMYRAVAWAGHRAAVTLTDEGQLTEFLATFNLEMSTGRVVVNGDDVTGVIRTAEITALSRPVADSPVVRRHLTQLQRQFAVGKNVITEGRDQGTLVFPHAECKFFLVANPEERARRRQRQMGTVGAAPPLDEVLRAQNERDESDAARVIAPMTPATDAIIVDSTGLASDQVVDLLESHVRARMHQGISA